MSVPIEIEDFEALGFRDNYLNTNAGKREVRKARKEAQKSTGDTQRYRCMTKGCNPVLFGEQSVAQHKADTGHNRIYKWPVRSAEGKRRQRQRNRSGYYRKYNAMAMGIIDYPEDTEQVQEGVQNNGSLVLKDYPIVTERVYKGEPLNEYFGEYVGGIHKPADWYDDDYYGVGQI